MEAFAVVLDRFDGDGPAELCIVVRGDGPKDAGVRAVATLPRHLPPGATGRYQVKWAWLAIVDLEPRPLRPFRPGDATYPMAESEGGA